jgi:lipopolysaccharide export system protein LptA
LFQLVLTELRQYFGTMYLSKCTLLRLVFPYSFFIVSSSLLAQKKTIELLGANTLQFDKNLGGGANRVIGNASFKDGNTYMYCDSAYLYTNNSADAFGHVHITQGDTVDTYGETLHFDGNSKMAELRKNVKLVDKDMTLTCNVLFFDTKNNLATYTGGGTIVNKENTLISDRGYYFTHTKKVAFKKNVVLSNPRYTMYSDTLNYNTTTKITYFLGPTTIVSKQDFIYCENGFYNTITDIAQFNKNAYIISKNQKIKGDSIYYNKVLGIGKGFDHISITDTTQNISITGDFGISNELFNTAFVTGHAQMIQVFTKDTLFMHGDTLKAEKDSVYQVMKAWHKVKFYKSDMQGKCDSLVYSYRDSAMHLFRDPVVWSSKKKQCTQLSADRIDLKTSKGVLKNMLLTNSAFIISQEDSLRFNQIKGKTMCGYFINNELYKILVNGNGQSIYYGAESPKENSKKKYIGVNKADCSEMLIFLKENQVSNITFITKPDATMYPIKELTPKELQLKDFAWRIQLKPAGKNDIFVWP